MQCKEWKRMFTHQGGVFLVSEGQLVGSKNQRRESEANPLVSACTKVFPRRVQDLKTNYMVNFKDWHQSNIYKHLQYFPVVLKAGPTRYCWSGSSEWSRWMKRPTRLCSSAKSSGSGSSAGWSGWSWISVETKFKMASTFKKQRERDAWVDVLR